MVKVTLLRVWEERALVLCAAHCVLILPLTARSAATVYNEAKGVFCMMQKTPF